MPEKKNNPQLLPVLGVLFTLIALVAMVALLRLKSLGDTTTTPVQTVTPGNISPTIGTILVQDAVTNDDVTIGGFTPYEATTHNLKVTATLHDDNGCKDLMSANYYVHLKDSGVKGGGGKPVGSLLDLSRKTAWGGAPENDPVLLAAQSHPMPVLNGLYPSSIAKGCDPAFITLAGEGFDTASVVKLDGETISSYYSSYDHFIYAIVPGAAIINAGTHSITVYNPPLDGGTSDPLTLTVLETGGVCSEESPQPIPVLNGLSPNVTAAGCAGFSMDLQGYGFTSQSVVKMDGDTIPSTYNADMHSLTASIPSGALATAGERVITVVNPSPIGGTSSPQSLVIMQTGSVQCAGAVTPSVPSCASELDAAGNYCYPVAITVQDMTNAGCVAGQTDVTVSKTIAIQNYANASDAGTYAELTWAADVVASDFSETGGQGSATFEMNSLAGFSTQGSINYGEVVLGAKAEQVFPVVSTGNRDVHALVRADGDMTSNLTGYANIPVGNVKYALTTPVSSGDSSVTTTDSLFQICLPQQTVDGVGNIPTKDTYWQLTMPSSGVNGTYQNTLTLTAQATTGCGTQVIPKGL